MNAAGKGEKKDGRGPESGFLKARGEVQVALLRDGTPAFNIVAEGLQCRVSQLMKCRREEAKGQAQKWICAHAMRLQRSIKSG